jgi:hypothetical protein
MESANDKNKLENAGSSTTATPTKKPGEPEPPSISVFTPIPKANPPELPQRDGERPRGAVHGESAAELMTLVEKERALRLLLEKMTKNKTEVQEELDAVVAARMEAGEESILGVTAEGGAPQGEGEGPTAFLPSSTLPGEPAGLNDRSADMTSRSDTIRGGVSGGASGGHGGAAGGDTEWTALTAARNAFLRVHPPVPNQKYSIGFPKFSGKVQEAEAFKALLDFYYTMGAPDEQILPKAVIALRGDVAVWLKGAGLAVTSFKTFRTQFNKQFCRVSVDVARAEALRYHQGHAQTVREYLVQKAARLRTARIEGELAASLAVSGLLPALAGDVWKEAKQPTTMDEVLDVAVRMENARKMYREAKGGVAAPVIEDDADSPPGYDDAEGEAERAGTVAPVIEAKDKPRTSPGAPLTTPASGGQSEQAIREIVASEIQARLPGQAQGPECWSCHLVGHLQRDCPAGRGQGGYGGPRGEAGRGRGGWRGRGGARGRGRGPPGQSSSQSHRQDRRGAGQQGNRPAPSGPHSSTGAPRDKEEEEC